MKIIKMKDGFTVINGKSYSVSDGAFKVDDDAKAARLVELGVAEYADDSDAVSDNDNEENNGDEVDVDSMSYDELKAKATELGIAYPGKKKAVLVEEIKIALADENDGTSDDAPTFNPSEMIQ